MIAAMKVLILLALTAVLAPGRRCGTDEEYHFELTKVLVKPEVNGDVAKTAQSRVEAQIKKAFESHPQLVANLEGAPDPDKSADAYASTGERKASRRPIW